MDRNEWKYATDVSNTEADQTNTAYSTTSSIKSCISIHTFVSLVLYN